MIVSNKHNIGVCANFDSGTFLNFSVFKANFKSYNKNDTNIQATESLTFEDFTALEIMIASTVSKFLDMKQREKEAIEREEEIDEKYN